MMCDAGAQVEPGAGRYIVEENRDGPKVHYIRNERFIKRSIGDDFTEDAIQALNHYIWELSGKRAVIIKLDCISVNFLTNLELVDLGYVFSLSLSFPLMSIYQSPNLNFLVA